MTHTVGTSSAPDLPMAEPVLRIVKALPLIFLGIDIIEYRQWIAQTLADPTCPIWAQIAIVAQVDPCPKLVATFTQALAAGELR